VSDANIAFVQEIYAAFGRGDLQAILGALTADVHWEMIGRPTDFPNFGPRRGVEGVGAFFQTVGETEEFDEFAPRTFHAAGDRVFVEGHAAGRLKSTGKPVVTEWLHVFTVRDGKVAGFREFLDTAQYAEAWKG
jgi:ketosteroid isomerase-like protein